MNMSEPQARREAVINASIGSIWSVITDISQLHKVNPGVVKATGAMNKEGSLRSCEMNNNGKKGTMTERLIELVPERKTVWLLENDTMGMSKMLRNTRFVFLLERIDEGRTKVVNETHYEPANLAARILNAVMMRKKIGRAQDQILRNIRALTER